MLKLRDIIAAEEAVEAAEAAYKKLNDDIDEWSAYESMDKRGKRTLNFTEVHFARRDAAQRGIATAEQRLLATKRGYLAGVIDHAEI